MARSDLEVMREQIKAGVHPRRALIESYMREWLSDPATASARLAAWEGTSTGDAIEEGRRMAEVALSVVSPSSRPGLGTEPNTEGGEDRG